MEIAVAPEGELLDSVVLQLASVVVMSADMGMLQMKKPPEGGLYEVLFTDEHLHSDSSSASFCPDLSWADCSADKNAAK